MLLISESLIDVDLWVIRGPSVYLKKVSKCWAPEIRNIAQEVPHDWATVAVKSL